MKQAYKTRQANAILTCRSRFLRTEGQLYNTLQISHVTTKMQFTQRVSLLNRPSHYSTNMQSKMPMYDKKEMPMYPGSCELTYSWNINQEHNAMTCWTTVKQALF